MIHFMFKAAVHKSDDADRKGGDVCPQTCDKPSSTGLLVDFNSSPMLIVHSRVSHQIQRRFV